MSKTIGVAFSALCLSACTFESVKHLPADDTLTSFQEIDTDFVHNWKDSSHPFSGAAAIDIDGDGSEEIFVGGGEGQMDVVLRYESGRLTAA